MVEKKVVEMKRKIGVIGSSEEKEEGMEKAREIGREIARAGCQLLTGACTGLPNRAAKGAKEAGGTTVGISPAQSEDEHRSEYHYPTEAHDILIYTGFGYKGRNVVLVRSCDGVIATGGRLGTLNELTVAHSDKKVVGLLTRISGASDEFKNISEKLGRPGRKIVESENPSELVGKVLEELESRENPPQ